MLDWLQALTLPKGARYEVRDELRKLIGYFENNRHWTNYPSYRQRGWDIGSGPTEAGCKNPAPSHKVTQGNDAHPPAHFPPRAVLAATTRQSRPAPRSKRKTAAVKGPQDRCFPCDGSSSCIFVSSRHLILWKRRFWICPGGT